MTPLQVAEAAQLSGGAPLAAFFQEGRSALGEADFLATLSTWTTAAVEALAADARRLFEFLCSLEEADRTEQIVVANWDDYLRRRSGEADSARPDTPDLPRQPRPAATLVRQSLQPALDALATAGLVELTAETKDQPTYGIHPGVAEAGRRLAGDEVQAAVDAELAVYWHTVFAHGMRTEMQGGGALVRVAGLRAAPYLMRRQRWQEASTLLEQVLQLDKSSATVAILLPLLRRIVEATADTLQGLENTGILSKVLLAAGRWQEAEAMELSRLEIYERPGHYRLASNAAGTIINIMMATGRAEAALEFVERKKGATKSAGLGPWTQLSDDGCRLQLLNELGRYKDVLAEVQRLRPTLAELPEDSGQEEAASPWNVRETLLNTGSAAALALEQWETCLELNADVQASEKKRDASELEQAGTRFNDYGPLLRLHRWDEVRNLLLECRSVFEAHNHIEYLGKVFSALADLEDKLGHHDRAVDTEEDGLRYSYVVREPGDCAASHFNLASNLGLARRAGYEARSLAHRLAAMTIFSQIGSGHFDAYLHVLARVISTLDGKSPAARLAAEDGSGFEAVVKIVEQVEGVRFGKLFESLPKNRAATGPEALAMVLTMARRQPVVASSNVPSDVETMKAAIFGAAAKGKDPKSLISKLRKRMLAEHPGEEQAVDAMITKLEAAIKADASGGA